MAECDCLSEYQDDTRSQRYIVTRPGHLPPLMPEYCTQGGPAPKLGIPTLSQHKAREFGFRPKRLGRWVELVV